MAVQYKTAINAAEYPYYSITISEIQSKNEKANIFFVGRKIL